MKPIALHYGADSIRMLRNDSYRYQHNWPKYLKAMTRKYALNKLYWVMVF